MSDVPLVCIDTQTGRATRYVRTKLVGKPVREAGALDIVDYHPCRPISEGTLQALEGWRKDATLA